MNNAKLIGVALLALGLVLLYFGLSAADSPTEEIGEALTGKYSDNTMMYLVGGGVAAIAGVFMLFIKK